MKLMMICPYTPYPLNEGGKVRVYNLLKRMAKVHDITLICFVKNKDEASGINELRKFCKKVIPVPRRPTWSPMNMLLALFTPYPFLFVCNGFSERLEKTIKDELRNNTYDLIQVEHFYEAHSIIRVLAKTKVPLILDEHNIEYRVYEGYLRSIINPLIKLIMFVDVWKMKRAEVKIWDHFKAIILSSSKDRELLGQVSKDKYVFVIPNGVDVKHYALQRSIEKRDNDMVFTGNFRYIANIDAMWYFTKKILPIIRKRCPSVKMTIAGSDPLNKARSFAGGSISVTGYIDDLRPCLDKCKVFVAPLRFGGGIKMKVLEAMAMGLPVVGTDVAFQGIDVIDSQDAMIADNEKDFAEKVTRLINNEGLRNKIGQNARKLVERKYDWDNIAQELNKFYSDVRGKWT